MRIEQSLDGLAIAATYGDDDSCWRSTYQPTLVEFPLDDGYLAEADEGVFTFVVRPTYVRYNPRSGDRDRVWSEPWQVLRIDLGLFPVLLGRS